MAPLSSRLLLLGGLALCSSAAPTDQIPLSQSTKVFRTSSRSQNSGHVVGIPPPTEQNSRSHVAYERGVKVQYFTFDDTWFENGHNGTYKSDWDGYLSFTNFNVFAPSASEAEGLVDYRDLNCAASKPNALYNTPKKSHTQSIIRSNATALAELGLSEFFDVIAWSWKPMGPTPAEGWPWLNMDLWKVKSDSKTSDEVTYEGSLGSVWFDTEDGFYEPDTMIPEWFYGEDWGKNVNWIEIDAKNYQEGGEPFSFCLDNIVLLFHELKK